MRPCQRVKKISSTEGRRSVQMQIEAETWVSKPLWPYCSRPIKPNAVPSPNMVVAQHSTTFIHDETKSRIQMCGCWMTSSHSCATTIREKPGTSVHLQRQHRNLLDIWLFLSLSPAALSQVAWRETLTRSQRWAYGSISMPLLSSFDATLHRLFYVRWVCKRSFSLVPLPWGTVRDGWLTHMNMSMQLVHSP